MKRPILCEADKVIDELEEGRDEPWCPEEAAMRPPVPLPGVRKLIRFLDGIEDFNADRMDPRRAAEHLGYLARCGRIDSASKFEATRALLRIVEMEPPGVPGTRSRSNYRDLLTEVIRALSGMGREARMALPTLLRARKEREEGDVQWSHRAITYIVEDDPEMIEAIAALAARDERRWRREATRRKPR